LKEYKRSLNFIAAQLKRDSRTTVALTQNNPYNLEATLYYSIFYATFAPLLKKSFMKRIIESRKLFAITENTDLGQLKLIYRNLMKQWHPDKFREGDEKAAEAEAMSKNIIEAYHFLVSIAPETHAAAASEYNATTNNCGISDFEYKGTTLKVSFTDGSTYEYFSVPRNIYIKLVNSATQARFARRHIFSTYLYRNVTKSAVAA
jgi:hypothetical protein